MPICYPSLHFVLHYPESCCCFFVWTGRCRVGRYSFTDKLTSSNWVFVAAVWRFWGCDILVYFLSPAIYLISSSFGFCSPHRRNWWTYFNYTKVLNVYNKENSTFIPYPQPLQIVISAMLRLNSSVEFMNPSRIIYFTASAPRSDVIGSSFFKLQQIAALRTQFRNLMWLRPLVFCLPFCGSMNMHGSLINNRPES